MRKRRTVKTVKRVTSQPEMVAKTIAVTPAPPLNVAGKDPWYRSILTDHNGDFDMGAVLVGIVAIFMCVNSGYDTWILHTKFNAQEFGIGIAAMLTGFAAYKYGDAKRPPGAMITTTTTEAAKP